MNTEQIREQCSNCGFWKPRSDTTRDLGGGYCQRFPPIFKEENALNDGWPNTHQQQWCGEWKSHPGNGEVEKPGTYDIVERLQDYDHPHSMGLRKKAATRIKELENALEPFALAADEFEDKPNAICVQDIPVTVGDLRRARAAIRRHNHGSA